LQGFKGPTTKSRVAGSKRARELRAAAALARFDKAISEPVKNESSEAEDEDDAHSDEEYEDADARFEDAEDIDGTKLTDGNGHNMIRVCEYEDTDDVQVKAEMDELNSLEDGYIYNSTQSRPIEQEEDLVRSEEETEPKSGTLESTALPMPQASTRPAERVSDSDRDWRSLHRVPQSPPQSQRSAGEARENQASETHLSGRSDFTGPAGLEKAEQVCGVCSMSNEPAALLCMACSNVLSVSRCPGAWKCESTPCAPGYLNPADFGVCGICGSRRG